MASKTGDMNNQAQVNLDTGYLIAVTVVQIVSLHTYAQTAMPIVQVLLNNFIAQFSLS